MGAPLSDCFTTQLEYAFAAANALDIGFTLFFSFDYVGGSEVWDAADIIDLLNQYGSNSAHFKYGENNYPFVSTFEGTDNIDDWNTIRSSVDQGGIYFVPDWTSLTPSGIDDHLDVIDGACKYLHTHTHSSASSHQPNRYLLTIFSLLGHVAHRPLQ